MTPRLLFRAFYLSFFGILFGSTSLIAQKEYNVWYFGYGAGLDFNSGSPVALMGGKTNQLEGCASVADDETGELLFYTDGLQVWNRLHQVMPNGDGLMGDGSSTQSAMIIGKPDDMGKYYVFTCDQGGYIQTNRGIHYSIVDMSLDGGLGDIVTTSKNVTLLGNK